MRRTKTARRWFPRAAGYWLGVLVVSCAGGSSPAQEEHPPARFEGRTVAEWIAHWDEGPLLEISTVTETLTRIGEPAIPALEKVILEGGANAQNALRALQGMGAVAIPALKRVRLALHWRLRGDATTVLADMVVEAGLQTRGEFYAEVALEDPLDPAVAGYVFSARDAHGGIMADLPAIEAALREKLAQSPDPQTALNLAYILEMLVSNTELTFARPRSSQSLPWEREDPSVHHGALAEVLEIGFRSCPKGSLLKDDLGAALARCHLLRGEWSSMNAVLESLGQKPVLEELRPLLSAPPQGWERELAARWTPCDPALRTGTSTLVIPIEKDGKGLAGVHVLVKKAPPRRNTSGSTGFREDTLFAYTGPLKGGLGDGSFGYAAADRNRTRYCVTDASGIARFEQLPAVPLKVEVLIPTANFQESGRAWELWVEWPDRPAECMTPGGPGDPGPAIGLEPGQTWTHPRLVVRPKQVFNVADGDAVREGLVLVWAGREETDEVEYELELAITTPDPDYFAPELAPVLDSATVQVQQASWPLGQDGVGHLRLVPGNLYLLRAWARNREGTILARWGRVRVWVPWTHRDSDPPVSSRASQGGTLWHDSGPPIGPTNFGAEQSRSSGRTRMTARRLVEDYLATKPDDFELEYVRVVQAWHLWQAGETDEARRRLAALVELLPAGNVARATAAWLLQSMARGDDPPRELTLRAPTR